MTKLFPCNPKSKRLLIYCSVVPHNFPPRHRLEFVKRLSRHCQVIFIDLPGGSYPSPFSSALKFSLSLVDTFFKFDHCFVWEFFRFRRLNDFGLFLYLQLQKLFFDKKVILYTTSGYEDRIYRAIPFDYSVFDCPDIHGGEFEGSRQWIQKFDLVFTNTRLVYNFVSMFNPRTMIIPSGYRSGEALSFIGKKIPDSVLFLGGISQRIDYDLLKKIVRGLPKLHFYFLGELYLKKYYVERQDSLRLKKWRQILVYPNVHYLRDVPYKALDSFLPFFEVGIIPYLTGDVFNNFSNPIKLYDYLASGISVVSSALPNVVSLARDYPVYIASSPEEFIRKIKQAQDKTDKDFLKYKKNINKLLGQESMEEKLAITLKNIKELIR